MTSNFGEMANAFVQCTTAHPYDVVCDSIIREIPYNYFSSKLYLGDEFIGPYLDEYLNEFMELIGNISDELEVGSAVDTNPIGCKSKSVYFIVTPHNEYSEFDFLHFEMLNEIYKELFDELIDAGDTSVCLPIFGLSDWNVINRATSIQMGKLYAMIYSNVFNKMLFTVQSTSDFQAAIK